MSTWSVSSEATTRRSGGTWRSSRVLEEDSREDRSISRRHFSLPSKPMTLRYIISARRSSRSKARIRSVSSRCTILLLAFLGMLAGVYHVYKVYLLMTSRRR